MTDVAPIDIAAATDSDSDESVLPIRSIPPWVWWIGGIMATITAVVVGWTLQKPVPPRLNPNWAPQCPRLEGEWMQTWEGDPDQLSYSMPQVIGDRLFQRTLLAKPLRKQIPTPEQRAAFKSAICALDGHPLLEWTGEKYYDCTLVGNQLVALDNESGHIALVRDTSLRDAPVSVWDLDATLKPNLPFQSEPPIWPLAYQNRLLLVLSPVASLAPEKTYICLLDPATRKFLAGLHWTQGDVQILTDANPGEGKLRLREMEGATRTFEWDYSAGTLSKVKLQAESEEPSPKIVNIERPKPGTVASWPLPGSNSPPTYVNSPAPGPKWKSFDTSRVEGNPPVGLIVQRWVKDPVDQTSQLGYQAHWQVGARVDWAAEQMDSLLGGEAWRNAAQQMGGAWLLREGQSGAEQISLDDHFFEGVEHTLQADGTDGIRIYASAEDRLALLQVIRATHLENGGVLRLGQVNETQDDLEWIGYWPLPKPEEEGTTRIRASRVRGNGHTWIWLGIYSHDHKKLLKTYFLEVPANARL